MAMMLLQLEILFANMTPNPGKKSRRDHTAPFGLSVCFGTLEVVLAGIFRIVHGPRNLPQSRSC